MSNREVFLRQVFSRKRATVARDEVHHSVCCLVVVPHLARLSRVCRGWPRPCLRRLSRGVLFSFFKNSCSDLKCLIVLMRPCLPIWPKKLFRPGCVLGSIV